MTDPQDEPSSQADRWRQDRREAAAAHADALAARQQAESRRAREMLAQFVAAALAGGPAPQPLVARSYDGRSVYRTDLTGWYLRADRTLAVCTDGEFYVLRAPRSLRARLRGVRVQPSDPPLVLGAGGRDGESIDLAVAIARLREGR